MNASSFQPLLLLGKVGTFQQRVINLAARLSKLSEQITGWVQAGSFVKSFDDISEQNRDIARIIHQDEATSETELISLCSKPSTLEIRYGEEAVKVAQAILNYYTERDNNSGNHRIALIHQIYDLLKQSHIKSSDYDTQMEALKSSAGKEIGEPKFYTQCVESMNLDKKCIKQGSLVFTWIKEAFENAPRFVSEKHLEKLKPFKHCMVNCLIGTIGIFFNANKSSKRKELSLGKLLEDPIFVPALRAIVYFAKA